MLGARSDRREANAGARLAALLVLLIAFALRAAIPDGWMPNASGSSEAPIVICTGAGPMKMGGHAGQAPAKGHGSSQSSVCPFAGVGSAPPSSPPTLVEPAAFARFERPLPPARFAAPPKERYREQSARAPPRQV